jgi:hypothetical protein
MHHQRKYLEIACQQVVTEDSSVFSIQWVDLPVELAGSLYLKELLTSYFNYIKKCTFSIIQPVVHESGIEFRLWGTDISLLSFLPPETADDSTTLHISGGFLTQSRQHNNGEFRFKLESYENSIRVSLQLTNFYPLLLGSHPASRGRLFLYRFTQATIHRRVTVAFLSLLYKELTGYSAKRRVVDVKVKAGKPV